MMKVKCPRHSRLVSRQNEVPAISTILYFSWSACKPTIKRSHNNDGNNNDGMKRLVWNQKVSSGMSGRFTQSKVWYKRSRHAHVMSARSRSFYYFTHGTGNARNEEDEMRLKRCEIKKDNVLRRLF